MRLFGYELSLRPVSSTGGWWPVVREPYTGAWQLNDPLTAATAFATASLYGALQRIVQDISKIAPPRLIQSAGDDIWVHTTNSAYDPVLRRPNHYQNPPQFVGQWVLNKLLAGNAYVLKKRDDRTVVNALHVLDSAGVKTLVAPDGSVYYELQPNDLAGIPTDTPPVIVPAREIIHDRFVGPHPLSGPSPLGSLGGSIGLAQAIQSAITAFFAKGGRPSGVLTAPTKLDPLSAQRMKEQLATMPPGGWLIAEGGVKYDAIGTSAADSQLIQLLAWIEEQIAIALGMPISILNSNRQPPYANAEASQLQYKSQTLEPLLRGIEFGLDEGLDLPSYLGIEFDTDLLISMDTNTRTTAAVSATKGGVLSPNEARSKYFGLPPIAGGETPYRQMQDIRYGEKPREEEVPT